MIELDLEGLQKHREQTVSDILELLKTEDRVGCVRYTGYGKSYFVMRRLIEELNEKVMILVPNKFLFNEYSNLYSNNDNVSIMTYHILKNVKNSQLDNLKDVKYVICDECHHLLAAKWNNEVKRILNELNCKVIGLTATPIRGDSKNVIEEFFNNVQVNPLDLIDGINLRFIPKLKYIVAYADIDDKYDKKLKDIDRYRIHNLLNVQNILKTYIPEERLLQNLKIPVFVPNAIYIDEAKQSCLKWFSEIYPTKNINIYSISYKDSYQQIENIKSKFISNKNSNDIDIMISIDMLKEGLHLPMLGIEIMLRKTKSPVVYFQQIGRVVGDTEPIIFDLINNQSHLYQLKREYKAITNKENWGTRQKKIMFEHCINLIDTTIEIENIYSKYNFIAFNTARIDKIIEDNIDFIVEQSPNYYINQMDRLLGLNHNTLARKLKDPKYSSYTFNFKNYHSREYIDELIKNNMEFIKDRLENSNNPNFKLICDKLQISISAFRDACKRLNLTRISANDLLLKNKDYIEQNPDNLSGTALAESFGINYSNFKKTCKELNINIGPYLHPLELRLKEDRIAIETNSNKITLNQLFKQYTTSKVTFVAACNRLGINLQKYESATYINDVYNSKIELLLENRDYIEQNPDKLSKKEMAKKFNIKESNYHDLIKKLEFDCTTNYNRRKKVIDIESLINNKEYIEQNPDGLSKKLMAKKFGMDVGTFKKYCKEHSIDTFTCYSITNYSSYKERCNKLLENKDYIEQNPDKLSRYNMARKLNTYHETLEKLCKYLGIDLETNYITRPKEIIARAHKILLENKDYIEQNPDKLTKCEMSKKFNINFARFSCYCKNLNIDCETNYHIWSSRLKMKQQPLIDNVDYIETNPDDLSRTGMAKYFKMNHPIFIAYCDELNIDIDTNYKAPRRKPKKM